MLSKQKTSRILFKQSRQLLNSNHQIILSPLVSNIIALALLALVIHPFIHHEATINFFKTTSILKIILFYLLVLLFLFVTHIFVFFFMATLTCQVLARLEHKPSDFIAAIKIVCCRFLPLYTWFLYASFVGFNFVILQKPLQRLAWFKTLTQGLYWQHAIYLIMPILLTTKIKTTDAIRKSSQLTARTWGSPLRYNHSLTGYSLPLKLIAFIPLLLALIQGSHLFIVLGSATSIFLLLIIASYFMSIRMIICCGCYHYAMKQHSTEFFNTEALASAFTPFVPD